MKKEKRFHIRCDMEGVSGVVDLAQVTPGAPEYAEARRYFMAELLALIEGLKDGGATDVSVYDEHWFGRNVDLSQIPVGVRVFCGKPPYRADWAGGLDASHAGMILHGLHSMEGTGETLAHTYEPDFRAIYINGRQVGEIGMETAIAGDWGVPLAMVVADSAGVDEAKALVPDVAGVSTKRSHCYHGAECHALVDNVNAIRVAARRLAETCPNIAPFQVAGPVELICEFKAGRYLDALRVRAKDAFVTENRLRLTAPTVTAAWADYWQLKLKVQADL